MMRIFILILFMVLSVSGFSQSIQANSQGWGNQFLDDNNLSSELKVYPNPCKDGKLTIEFAAQEITEVRITNIAGKEVLVKTFPSPENKKQIQLNELPSGIYLVRIKTTDNKQVVKKLMVSKN